MMRIERMTSPLPRECSTTEPHGQGSGAGEGNRTLVGGLEGPSSTIELHPLKFEDYIIPPRGTFLLNCCSSIAGGGGWIRTIVGVSQQIYSLPPLATRAPLRSEWQIMRVVGDFVKLSGEKQHRNTSADLKSARFSSGLFFSLLPGRRALYLKIPALSGHAQKSLQQYAHKETNPACAPHQSRPGKIASGDKAPLLTFGPVHVPRPQPRHHERHGKIRADQNQQNSEVSEASGHSSRGHVCGASGKTHGRCKKHDLLTDRHFLCPAAVVSLIV